MKSKRRFTPGSGENVASRIRQKFRLVKGGNPQLVLVHYGSNQTVRKSPSPSKIYPTPSTFPIHYFMKNSLKYRHLAKGFSCWNPSPNSIAVHAIKRLVAPRSLRRPTLLEPSRLILESCSGKLNARSCQTVRTG